VQKSGAMACNLILKIRLGAKSHNVSEVKKVHVICDFSFDDGFPIAIREIRPLLMVNVIPALSSWMPLMRLMCAIGICSTFCSMMW
jgi:hypothetical protein